MGAPLDPVAFLSQPNTVLRMLELVISFAFLLEPTYLHDQPLQIFAIIVFGIIADACFVDFGSGRVSVFNRSDGAANFGIAIGVLSFLASLAWLMISFLNKTSSMFTQQRPLLAKLEVGTDAFLSVWFFHRFSCSLFMLSNVLQYSNVVYCCHCSGFPMVKGFKSRTG
jgi:hypothetical protein